MEKQSELHLFMQKVEQGDGEKLKRYYRNMISVLEWKHFNANPTPDFIDNGLYIVYLSFFAIGSCCLQALPVIWCADIQ